MGTNYSDLDDPMNGVNMEMGMGGEGWGWWWVIFISVVDRFF